MKKITSIFKLLFLNLFFILLTNIGNTKNCFQDNLAPPTYLNYDNDSNIIKHIIKELSNFENFLQSLPTNIISKLNEKVNSFYKLHFLGVYLGIFGESLCLQVYLEIKINGVDYNGYQGVLSYLNPDEQKIFLSALTKNKNIVTIKQKKHNYLHMINLSSVDQVIKNNPDYFPVDAYKNPRKWLIENYEEWNSKNQSKKQIIRYGLMSGFPRYSTESYFSYNQILDILEEKLTEIELDSFYNIINQKEFLEAQHHQKIKILHDKLSGIITSEQMEFLAKIREHKKSIFEYFNFVSFTPDDDIFIEKLNNNFILAIKYAKQNNILGKNVLTFIQNSGLNAIIEHNDNTQINTTNFQIAA